MSSQIRLCDFRGAPGEVAWIGLDQVVLISLHTDHGDAPDDPSAAVLLSLKRVEVDTLVQIGRVPPLPRPTTPAPGRSEDV